MWRGLPRTIVPTLVVNWLVVVESYVLMLVGVTPEPLRIVEPKITLYMVGFSFLILIGVAFVFYLVVLLFNWPKAIVPPYLRHERGPIMEWLEGRHADERRLGRSRRKSESD